MRVTRLSWICGILFALTLSACGGGGGGGIDPGIKYSLGGAITGLTADGLIVANGTATQSVNSGASSYSFSNLDSGSSYNLSIAHQPSGLECTFVSSNNSGTLNGNVTGIDINCKAVFTLGGTITGLTGTGLVIQNGSATATISGNTFFFSGKLKTGDHYDVQVTSPDQQCTVSNGIGDVASADITDVAITCKSLYTVGGIVTGLSGADLLVLQDNGGDDLTLGATGTFTFHTALVSGSTYAVTVKTPPSGQSCSVVSNGSGLVTANVTNVAITCSALLYTIGGTVVGLTATDLVLQDNGGDDLAVSAASPSFPSFTFAIALTDSSKYAVTIKTPQPSGGQYCSVSNGSGNGTVASANVTNVTINCISPPTQPSVTVGYGIKQVKLSWTVPGGDATPYYKVSKSSDGSTYTTLASNLTTATYTDTVAVHLTDWVNTAYTVTACNDAGCSSPSAPITGLSSVPAIGYFKPNGGTGEEFGYSMALSKDGSTLAVGAWHEQQLKAKEAGGVYIFTQETTGSTWTLKDHLRASDFGGNDQFGNSVALSEKGDVLAVGAHLKDSESVADSGAVYIFARDSSGNWQQQTQLDASKAIGSSAKQGAEFGYSVVLSDDGGTLAVGAYHEDGGSYADSGAVYVFTNSASSSGSFSWTGQRLQASNLQADAEFGYSVALTGDGKTMAAGAWLEDYSYSNTTGIPQHYQAAGAVHTFTLGGNGYSWTEDALPLYASTTRGNNNSHANDSFGNSVALSEDGTTLAVGAYLLDDGTAADSGAAYVFTRSTGGSNWGTPAYLKGAAATDNFGNAVSLSADGKTLAVGAWLEDSTAKGINNAPDSGAADSGAVYVFTRPDTTGNVWTQKSYVKASNTSASDHFGISVALSGDGNILAVGANQETGNATGVVANQSDQNNRTSGSDRGAVYLY